MAEMPPASFSGGEADAGVLEGVRPLVHKGPEGHGRRCEACFRFQLERAGL